MIGGISIFNHSALCRVEQEWKYRDQFGDYCNRVNGGLD